MAYCTLTDLEKLVPEDELVQLTDDAGAGTVDAGVVAAAIEDADEEVDAFLAVRYSLPLATVPALVRRISGSLAICQLYSRRSHLKLPESWKDKCDRARRLLETIAKGTLALGAPDPPADADGGVEATHTTDDRVFTKDTLGNY